MVGVSFDAPAYTADADCISGDLLAKVNSWGDQLGVQPGRGSALWVSLHRFLFLWIATQATFTVPDDARAAVERDVVGLDEVEARSMDFVPGLHSYYRSRSGLAAGRLAGAAPQSSP